MSEWLLSDMVTPMWVWLASVIMLAAGWLMVGRLLNECRGDLEKAQAYYFAARLHTALHGSSPTDSENAK